MRAGLAYVAKHGYLKAFLSFNAVFFTFMGPLEFLTPLQIARTYGEEVWRLSAIEVSFSLGMLVGSVVMASWGGFSDRLHIGVGRRHLRRLRCRAGLAAPSGRTCS